MTDPQQPADVPSAPSGPRRISSAEFLARGVLEPGINRYIDEVLAKGTEDKPITERQMLAACIYLLHAIGHSMPFDANSGLDAVRAAKVGDTISEIAPTWRECIGVVLGIQFSRITPPPAPEKLAKQPEPSEQPEDTDGA